MNTKAKVGLTAIIVVILAAILWGMRAHMPAHKPDRLANSVSYACDKGKTIAAAFYDGEAKPAADMSTPPVPGGSAALTLSDGRSMTIHQTISADGVRYANADESFVFWTKG